MAHLIGTRVGPKHGTEHFLTGENFLPLPRFKPLIDQSVAGRQSCIISGFLQSY